MSGPKTARYTLTLEQQRILQEQRKRKKEYEKMKRLQNEVRSTILRFNMVFEKIEPVCRETNMGSELIEKMKIMKQQAVKTWNQASVMKKESTLADLEKINRNLQQLTLEMEEGTKELETEMRSLEKEFRTELGRKIADAGKISFTGSEKQKKKELYQKVQEALKSISDMNISAEQSRRLQMICEKAREIEDIGFLKNYYAMTVSPFIKECRIYHKLEEEKEQFREEQVYIRRCVDEAMQEMGYMLLGQCTDEKTFRNELYLFQEGTAVNVMYSDDGQITMELGGISENERVPNDSEKDSLVNDMTAFCEDYGEIQRILREKGVLGNQITILPPDARYAKMLDISRYNLHEEVSEYRAGGIKKKKSERKIMRVGE